MKLSQDRVRHLAAALVSRLEGEGYLQIAGTKSSVIEAVGQAIADELQVEDRLNAEVRALLKPYEADIAAGRVDYQKMFTMIKNKLVRERGLVL
ncbi:DUF507 family protein [Nitrospira sp. Kam-Ns4a]